MDPLDKLHQESDSSLILANEAQKRGNKIFIYQTDQLSLINDQVFALLNPLKLIKKKNKYQFKLGPSKNINLSKMDIILMRQDPPFNLNYITATYILEHLYPKTIVINNPESVRNAPEKIYSKGSIILSTSVHQPISLGYTLPLFSDDKKQGGIT